MKYGLVAFLLLTSQAFAATLQLQPGETATIQANVTTQVSCESHGGGGAPDCADFVDSFKATMAACSKSYAGGSCVSKHWPTFKSAHPDCTYAGIAICLKYCEESYAGGTCADMCQ